MKRRIKSVLFSVTIVLFVIGSLNFIIDPYFHYRRPSSFLAYPIEYQRYQNDGIVKNFEYDAIISGSSMCENFNASELDTLFNTSSIKVPSSGGSYKEINDLIVTGIRNNKNIKMVVRGLDYNRLTDSSDKIRYDEDWYPTYLYDDNPFNDVKYLLNKSTLFSSISVIINTLLGNKTTTFDEYSNWMKDYSLGKEYIHFGRVEKGSTEDQYSENDYTNEIDNLEKNIISVARDNPEIDFYYFLTPYSIVYFYNAYQSNTLNKQFDAEKVAIETMLEYKNIHLFSFFDEFDIICNLDNYRDITHYGEHVNTYILECMKTRKHELNKDNYQEYLREVKEFYTNYNYDSLFE